MCCIICIISCNTISCKQNLYNFYKLSYIFCVYWIYFSFFFLEFNIIKNFLLSLSILYTLYIYIYIVLLMFVANVILWTLKNNLFFLKYFDNHLQSIFVNRIHSLNIDVNNSLTKNFCKQKCWNYLEMFNPIFSQVFETTCIIYIYINRHIYHRF